MTEIIILLVALFALSYLWVLSVRRQFTQHHKARRSKQQSRPFHHSHTPSDGVAARH